MKITIVTPTLRKEGLNVVRQAIKKQTLFQESEWLIGSRFDPEIQEARWIQDDFQDGFWSLNRIYNKLFREAKGEIIVTWQDWIWAPKDALERFITAQEKYQAVISGVGDQYERLNQFGKPEVKIWSDPRKNLNNGSFYECYPNDAEWNFCSFPKKFITAIGGMDEQLDFLGYGGDQLQAVERMDTLGYKFYIDQANESFTVRHGREDFGGQEKWDKNHTLFNGEYDKRKIQLLTSGQWPKLTYI